MLRNSLLRFQENAASGLGSFISFADASFQLNKFPANKTLFPFVPMGVAFSCKPEEFGGLHASSRLPSPHVPRRRRRSAVVNYRRKAPRCNSRFTGQLFSQRHSHARPR